MHWTLFHLFCIHFYLGHSISYTGLQFITFKYSPIFDKTIGTEINTFVITKVINNNYKGKYCLTKTFNEMKTIIFLYTTIKFDFR